MLWYLKSAARFYKNSTSIDVKISNESTFSIIAKGAGVKLVIKRKYSRPRNCYLENYPFVFHQEYNKHFLIIDITLCFSHSKPS